MGQSVFSVDVVVSFTVVIFVMFRTLFWHFFYMFCSMGLTRLRRTRFSSLGSRDEVSNGSSWFSGWNRRLDGGNDGCVLYTSFLPLWQNETLSMLLSLTTAMWSKDCRFGQVLHNVSELVPCLSCVSSRLALALRRVLSCTRVCWCRTVVFFDTCYLGGGPFCNER